MRVKFILTPESSNTHAQGRPTHQRPRWGSLGVFVAFMCMPGGVGLGRTSSVYIPDSPICNWAPMFSHQHPVPGPPTFLEKITVWTRFAFSRAVEGVVWVWECVHMYAWTRQMMERRKMSSCFFGKKCISIYVCVFIDLQICLCYCILLQNGSYWWRAPLPGQLSLQLPVNQEYS